MNKRKKRESPKQRVLRFWAYKRNGWLISINGVKKSATIDNIALKLGYTREFVMRTIQLYENNGKKYILSSPHIIVWLSKIDPYYTNELDYGFTTERTYRYEDVKNEGEFPNIPKYANVLKYTDIDILRYLELI